MSKVSRIRREPWIRWLLRLTFATLALGLLLARIDLTSVLKILKVVNRQLLVQGFILYLAFRYVLAYQMSFGLAPLHMRFTTLQLLRISLISTFYSLILPGNSIAGSTASWYKLARPSGKIIEAGALVIYFRLINVLTLAGIGLAGTWYDQMLASPAFRAVAGMMFLGTVLFLIPLVSPLGAHWVERRGSSLLGHWPLPDWLSAKSQKVWQAFTAFHALDRRTIALILGLSLLSNVLGVVIWFVLALAVDINLSIFVIGWVSSFLGIVQMVPVTIAGLGVREASLVLFLGKYGIPDAQSLSFALAVFSLTIVSGLLGGLLEGWELLRGSRRATHSILERQANAGTDSAHCRHLKQPDPVCQPAQDSISTYRHKIGRKTLPWN